MTFDPGSGEDRGQQGGPGWPPPQPGQPPYPGGYPQQQPAPGWGPGGPGGPGGPPGPPPAGYPAAPGGGFGPADLQPQRKGFFGALFDFGFDSFATPAAVKVLYIIGMVLLGLAYVVNVITTFSTLGAGLGLVVLIVGALVVLFVLTLFRVTLEFYYSVVRMSEDIHHRRS